MQKKYYCIQCGAELPEMNLKYPYCAKCGCSCSACDRFSSVDTPAYYCHVCGEQDYISSENPLCSECKSKVKENFKN